MPQVEIRDIAHLRELIGKEIVLGEWMEITQQRIDLFAEATGDKQWIHTDPQRAANESPFGATVAHGFLTLSLFAQIVDSSLLIPGVTMGVNYGLNRVRFIAPVTAGSRIRGRLTLGGVEEISGGVQLTWNGVMEIEGADKPACVAELISRSYY